MELHVPSAWRNQGAFVAVVVARSWDVQRLMKERKSNEKCGKTFGGLLTDLNLIVQPNPSPPSSRSATPSKLAGSTFRVNSDAETDLNDGNRLVYKLRGR